MNAPNPPLKAAIVPVTAFQQNCTLLWCTETNKAAFVDPGGDLDKPEVAGRVDAAGAGVNLKTGRPRPAAVRAFRAGCRSVTL